LNAEQLQNIDKQDYTPATKVIRIYRETANFPVQLESFQVPTFTEEVLP